MYYKDEEDGEFKVLIDEQHFVEQLKQHLPDGSRLYRVLECPSIKYLYLAN